MVIDYILDRKDGYGYDVKEFYDACMAYEEFDIARALDSGTEKDVKKALCNYVIDNDYPKSICKYINSENWLEEFEESKKSARKSIKESDDDIITVKEFEERLSKGLKIIKDYFEERWGSDIHLKYAKGIFDIWAVGEAKRYECINTKGTYFKQMSKNEKAKALEFNDLLEQEFKDYAKELVKEYQKKYPIEESKTSARKSLKEMFDDEGIVDDFIDFLIYDCGYDEKTVEKYFYKKYKLNGSDVIPTKLYIQIKNEIEDALGYNDII